MKSTRRSAALVVVLVAGGCGSAPAGPPDAGPADATAGETLLDTSQSTSDPSVEIQLVNVGQAELFLDASINRDCDPPYYTLHRVGEKEALLDRPPLLACRCDNCSAAGCQGLADGSPRYLIIPAGGTATVHWNGALYTPASGCGKGCLAKTAAGAGPFEVRVRYRVGGALDCPNGGVADWVPEEQLPPDGRIVTCQPGSVRCVGGTASSLLDKQIVLPLDLSAKPMRVELQ